LIQACETLGIKAAVSKGWADGGNGTTNLANSVIQEIDNNSSNFKPLYQKNDTIKNKIETIAKEIYGAEGVNYSTQAERGLRSIEKLNLSGLPICMAKTQKSFSDQEKLLGRPTNFSVTVREFEIAAGAGFIIPILGNMMLMLGLPSIPASEGMNIDENGIVSGLS
jgi:formate--tetrahydrofolate ligase